MSNKISVVTSECASVTGHLDGHGGAPVQYGAHHPMQHDQGFTRSHWTPPSGDYSLVTINSTIMKHVPTLLAVSMAIEMRRYYISRINRWRWFVAFIKATKHHHRMSTCSDSINQTRQRRLFQTFHREKELQWTCWPLITIGVWQIKLTRSTYQFFQHNLLRWLN